MAGGLDPVKDFRVALEELHGNNRSQIRCLTLLAEDYESHCGPIVEAIESRIYTVTPNQKVTVLYVVDSIIKSRELASYRREFAKKIFRIFLHVFISGNESVRLSLFKLRQTWSNIFPHSVLQLLDKRVQLEDGAWPVASSGNAVQSVGGNQESPVTLPENWRSTENQRAAATPHSHGVTDIIGSIMNISDPRHVTNAATPLGSKRSGDHIDFSNQIKRSSPSVSLQDVDLRRVSLTHSASPASPVMSVITNFDQSWRTPSHSPVSRFSGVPPHGQSRSDVPPPILPFVPEDYSCRPGTLSSNDEPVAISTETVKLIGIPENNRIFVDGRAHEVIFIEDIAVVERNGLPHRIFFSGPPRNVIIDNIPHKLAFGERLIVCIDGLQHVLRFGAPSRELYMGNFSFKGIFGGPPIIAHINNQRHEIRLGGPAPEVKIEPEPSHDLYRFMSQRREQKQPEETQGQQITHFLTGVLKKVKEISSAKTTPIVAKKKSQEFNDLAEPIPYRDSLVQIQRQFTPSHSLKDFDMKTLRVRYGVFVNALHEKSKNACSQCGLRIDSKSEKYMQHMDWHVKRNLQRMERTSNCRPLYCAAKDWLRNDPDTSFVSSGRDRSLDSATSIAFTESHNVEKENCNVCGEQFAEVYDTEADKWMLKDCVRVNGNVFHSGCEPDSSHVAFSTKKEADFSVDDYCIDNFDKEMKLDPVFKISG